MVSNARQITRAEVENAISLCVANENNFRDRRFVGEKRAAEKRTERARAILRQMGEHNVIGADEVAVEDVDLIDNTTNEARRIA